MTMWVPTLSGSGSRYRQLADAIEAAVGSGELAAGEKLTPQRRLAYALGVTTGTITRAYSEAERRGLVEARVGSGTFVRASGGSAAFTHVQQASETPGLVDLSLSLPPPYPGRTAGLKRAIAAVHDDERMLAHAVAYQPEDGLAAHRECLAAWLAKLGLPMPASELVVNQGGMHGIYLTLSALCGPNARLAAETLSYPGLISAAQQLALRTVSVPFDAHGVDIEALARRYDRQPFRALYLMPDHHNPTTTRLSEERRVALVALARARDFWLIEDGVMHLPAPQRGTPLYQLAPERTVYLFSVSKILAGGLRTGVMRVPESLGARVRAAIRAQSWMPPPLMASLVCEWIANGDADRLLAWQDAELGRRQALAAERLHDVDFVARPGGFFIWLPLPSGLRAAPIVDQLEQLGVRVTAAEAFCVGSEPAPQAVRVCLSAARDLAALTQALDHIRAVLLRPDPAPWRTL
ncbi:aminotransferase-like domain-containing protein [Salinisphaera aquimarina]|uniref:PLP-dependent aminotransferase family protein n=1 Tax=Salinisphaera aquimarina TaxID=2094031 RepID=A0ABV7EK36_9GAMM